MFCFRYVMFSLCYVLVMLCFPYVMFSLCYVFVVLCFPYVMFSLSYVYVMFIFNDLFQIYSAPIALVLYTVTTTRLPLQQDSKGMQQLTDFSQTRSSLVSRMLNIRELLNYILVMCLPLKPT